MVVVLVVASIARAQPALPEGAPIKAVEIIGNDRVSRVYIQRNLESAVGRAYSGATLARDQRRLLRTGKFTLVAAAARLDDGEAIVTITVTEKPQVQSIEFIGNVKFKEKDLRDELDFTEGDPLDQAAITRGRGNIERLYRDAGRYFVEVTVDSERLERDQVVTYTLVEGPRVRVRKIRFEGNTAFRDRALLAEVATKTYLWIFRPGEFDADRLTRDVNALIDYYRRRGYLDVKVGYELEFSDDRERLTILFQIVEGTEYRVRAVHLSGNTVFTSDELLGVMRTYAGLVLLGDRLDSDVRAISRQYGENGYIDVRVRAQDPVYIEDEPDQVELTIAIDEGPQVRVGLIDIVGNQLTRDKVIRRELRFFPGEIYNTTTMEQAEQRLVETQLFSRDTTVEPVGSDPEIRDARVDVAESSRQGNFTFGVGLSSDSGVLGNIAVTHRNFDLFDWPRSTTELFKAKAFRGAGQYARVSFQPSTEFTRFRIDFREPYLLDQPISFGIGLYAFQRARDAYTERRAGVDFSFRKRFEKGPLKDWSGEIGLRTEWIGVSGVNFYDAPDVREHAGGNFLTSVRAALAHDTTDSFFLPSRGHRFTASWEQVGTLGGDFLFAKTEARYVWHKTLRVDAFDRKSILSLRGQVNQIFGDAPLFERYYAGGIGSLRGFDFRGVTPRDGLFQDRIGGDFRLLAGASYSFPVFGKTLRGVLFTDMGTVEENFELTDWRATIGIGLRLEIEFFGPVPLEFDLALPVAKSEDDDVRIFNFAISTSF